MSNDSLLIDSNDYTPDCQDTVKTDATVRRTVRPDNQEASTQGNSDRRYLGAYRNRARVQEADPGISVSVPEAYGLSRAHGTESRGPSLLARLARHYKDYVALTFLGSFHAQRGTSWY